MHKPSQFSAHDGPVDQAGEPPIPLDAWHTRPVSDVAAALQTDPEGGLAPDEAVRRLRRHGPNRLSASQGRTPLAILLAQFRSLIVVLLVGATVVAFALGETVEAIAILIVVVLNTALGFFTEWRAERTLASLQNQTVPTAHVVRGGQERQIRSTELVPGDVVVLAAGARVPADGRIVEAVQLQIEEAALTGESLPVAKSPEPIPDPTAPLGDRTGLAYMGTTITDGRGRMIVTATGARTEVGRIGTLLDESTAGETPLERKLAQLGHVLIGIVLVLCAVLVAVGSLRGRPLLPMLEIGVTLAIAAVPEGLPAVATMTLALGVRRMARLRALIRRLPAVETLGSTTVICTDKTGTLTRNEMTVQAFVLGERRIAVTGTGYSASGEFRDDGQSIDPRADAHLALALRIGALCNDASLDRRAGETVVLGDPTEGALIVAAGKAGFDQLALERDYPRLGEIPFDSVTKRMATAHRTPEGGLVAFVKGAPGALLACCHRQLDPGGSLDLTDDDRRRITEINEELASAALRVLGLAYRELPEGYGEDDLGRDLTFVGLVGMIDPLRPEVREAISTCREAGIRVVMITGDQAATAAEIARQLGIDRDPRGRPLESAHARDLEGLDDSGWERAVASAGVFARVSPEHKLRLVEALQRRGEVVAMTGDGVNDAPALKRADIGVAMGIKGTEVAKETADMIITDDNFATIVGAVEQGRMIYANIRKFLHYLFSCNFTGILVVFVAILIGWPSPLAAMQILWLNMITDVLPALALAVEPSSPGIMKRPPRDPKERLLSLRFCGLVAWQAALIAAVTLVAFGIGLHWYGRVGEGLVHATTMSFMTLALARVIHVFNTRSKRRSTFSSGLFANGWLWAAVLVCLALQGVAIVVPLLQRVLRVVPPSAADWGVIVLCSLVPVAVVEVVKLIGRWRMTVPAGLDRSRGNASMNGAR